MRRSTAFLAGIALVLLARVAWPSDFTGGEFSTEGMSADLGTYKGTVKVTPNADGTYNVTESIRFASGKKAKFSGDGRLSGDALVVDGATGVGFIGKLDKKKGDEWSATFAVGPDGTLVSGSWKLAKEGSSGVDTITGSKGAAPAGDLLVLLDGDGKEVPKAKKNTDGVLLQTNIDDDDNDGGAGGDGETKIVSDKDDEDGVPGEDDLLAFKLVKPASTAAGAKFVLKFGDKLAVWRSKEKMPGTRIKSGESFEAKDETLWLEGRDASAGGVAETLAVSLEVDGHAVLEDSGKVWVARSAFLLLGHGNAGSWALESWLDSHKADGRKNPVLVRGKDEKGKTQAWAVYVWNTEKQAKIALATPGAVIAYDGHSNFGLGYAFATHFTRVSQFMNIADAQVPVNWEYLRDHQEHPDLMFEDSEYGDDSSTDEFSDPVAVDRTVEGSKDNYSTRRWPENGSASGTRYHLVRGKEFKWQDYHYLLDNDPTNARIVVKAGAKDMPEKRWGKLYLNSCYSGPYYFDSFGGRGTLFYTTEESSSPQTSALFLESCIEGKSNDDTLKALNKAENINDYHVFGD